MSALAWLIPCALALGALGLTAFLWSLNSGQFEDLDGAGWRAIEDEDDGRTGEATRPHGGDGPPVASVTFTSVASFGSLSTPNPSLRHIWIIAPLVASTLP